MNGNHVPGTGPAPEANSGKKTAACCGFGCLAVLVISVVAVIGAMAWGKKTVGEFADKYTSEEPVRIEMPVLSEQQVSDATTRFDQFVADVSAGNGGQPLVLSESDINALFSGHPKFSALAKSAVASIENDQLTVQSSFDIDAMGIPFPGFIADKVKGKYFNGAITVEVTTIGGQPAVFIQDIAAGDAPIPQIFIDSLKTENLLQNQNSDPDMRKVLEKLEEIKIENNQLVIVPAAP